jgi:colanic acid biosynthesis glycosyl transferase WcaI
MSKRLGHGWYSSQTLLTPRSEEPVDHRRRSVRLSIINLFYPPDLAPSAHLVASLAEHRAALGDDVTVFCGKGSYLGGSAKSDVDPSDERAATEPARAQVRRLWTPGLGKSNTVHRLGDYLSFVIGAVVRLASFRRQDVIVSLTTPPYILIAAVAHRLVHPRTRILLWSLDIYPDAAEIYGGIRAGGFLSRALRALNRWLFRRVDHVVALDQAMLHRVLSYARNGTPGGSVIPTWEPAEMFPSGDRHIAWSGYEEADLAGRFIVLHRGNLGLGHRIDTIADAAAQLADEAAFLFVGGGTRFAQLAAEAKRRNLENVRFRDYVPRADIPGVLAGAGCSLISLDDRALGIMSPSKMNGSLAMGIPLVYCGPRGTNVDEAITTYRCGFSLRQGDVEGLVDGIRRLRDDRELAAEMSRNARRAFEDGLSDTKTLPRFDAILEELSGAWP